MIRLFRTRKSSAVALLLVGVFVLISAISTTVKLNSEIIDYHSLTEDNVKSGKLCQGTIDEWYGPYAYTDDGAEIYFMVLDNGQFISFKTYDDDQKSIFLSYDEDSTENKQVEFMGELEKTPSHDRYVLLGILTDEGYSAEEAEKELLPYYVKNFNPSGNKYMYMVAIVLMGVGILLFLPEISSLFGKKAVQGLDYKPVNYNTGESNGYQNTYAGASKTYTGLQSNTYGDTTAQQSTAQGQNRTYTGTSYSSTYSSAQGQNRDNTATGQNRSYTGTSYSSTYSSAQGQNRDNTATGQNRSYTGTSYSSPYSNAQGQNRDNTATGQDRTYTGSSYSSPYSSAQGQNRDNTATGQNREYTGTSYSSPYSSAQGQNRDYTATSQNRDFTSDKADDSTQVWGDSDTESKNSEW